MRFAFERPVFAREHFHIPVDMTPWNAGAEAYASIDGKVTPNRPRAYTPAQGMRPATDYGQALARRRGIYVLLLEHPRRTIYVGIAAGETILSRIRKHRIKLTGSNAGAFDAAQGVATTYGGVHHPHNWKIFATERYSHLRTVAENDGLDDLRLMIGSFDDPRHNIRQNLEPIESALINAGQLRDGLLQCAWSDVMAEDLFWLNGACNWHAAPTHPVIYPIRPAD